MDNIADNYTLYGPGGASPVNIGSWLTADPGPDFDPDFFADEFADSAGADVAAHALSRARSRRFRFPLLAASGGAGLSLTALESLLRQNARPGGYIDLQPEGVASAEAVRFDLIGGRWKPDYKVWNQRVLRRQGELELQVQPYGYWPTWINLVAVAGGATLPRLGHLDVASRIGDAPADLRLRILPSVATRFSSTAETEALVWALGGPSSGVLLATNPLFTNASVAATAQTEAFLTGVSATVSQYFWTQATTALLQLGGWDVSAAAPGLYRAFVYARLGPSQLLPFRLALDPTLTALSSADRIASGAPVATLPPAIASGIAPWGVSASPAYYVLDMGVVDTMQGVPSLGTGGARVLRLYAAAATTNIGVSTAVLNVGGMMLVPQSGFAGVLRGGLYSPSINAPGNTSVWFDLDSFQRTLTGRTIGTASLLDTDAARIDLRQYHYGPNPKWGASSVPFQLFSLGLIRGSSPTGAAFQHHGHTQARFDVDYRPRFHFLRGI